MPQNFESLPNSEAPEGGGGEWDSLAGYPDFETFREQETEPETPEQFEAPRQFEQPEQPHAELPQQPEKREAKELAKDHERKLGVEIMELTPDDDFEQVADALYLVDQYIFPDLFDNEEKAKVLTRELFTDDPDALFSFHKTLVAKDDEGNIVGILVYRDSQCTHWDTDAVRERFLSTGLELPEQFERANEGYMKKITDAELPEGAAEIEFVGVREAYRANGIGGRLMKTVMDEMGYSEAHLDVLDSHPGARRLYDKLGFKPAGEKFGNYPDGSEGVQHMICKKESE